MNSNPLRILDTKNKSEIELLKKAPMITEYLSNDDEIHFNEVQQYLNDLNIPFTLDTNLVRGLDYYCHTVFEFKNNNLGTQNTLIGGGRYDGLVKIIGGPDIPGVGWAGGIERLMLLMDLPKINNIKNHLIVINESLKSYGMNVFNKTISIEITRFAFLSKIILGSVGNNV